MTNNTSRSHQQRRWGVLALTLVVAYAILGANGHVPWFETTSCAGHMAKARRAMRDGKSMVATRHILAAMRQTKRDPRLATPCWALLGDGFLWLEDTEMRYPSSKTLTRMLRTGDPYKKVRALEMLAARYQLQFAIKKLNTAIEAVLTAEERTPTDIKRYDRLTRMMIYSYQRPDSRGALQAVLLRRHRHFVTVLPPGDQRIRDSLEAIDYQYDTTLSSADKRELYTLEIQRCAQAKPCPVVAMMRLENRSIRYATATEQPAIAARCLALLGQYLTDRSIPAASFDYSPDAGTWLAAYLQRGQYAEAQRQLDRVMSAASATTPDKRAQAADILADCARCWSLSGGGYTGSVPCHTPDVRTLRKILAVQEALAPATVSTAVVWGMLGEIYVAKHDDVEAERCYNRSFKALDHVCGCDVTRLLRAHREPGRGRYNAVIWDVYGGGPASGYIGLLRRTGRAKIAEEILPMLD